VQITESSLYRNWTKLLFLKINKTDSKEDYCGVELLPIWRWNTREAEKLSILSKR
jgi:hypothetical protein